MSTELLEHKYAPSTMAEMICDADTKMKLTKAIKELPNMLIYGPPGVGKGTFVEILRKETGIECLKINCSDETGIDNIRDKVKGFSTAMGLGGIKLVYLNECDWLSPAAQAMLRDLIESVQSVTRFILCCNYIHKVIPELQSRCQLYELSNPPAKEVALRCFNILNKEGVKYDKKVVIDLIKTIWQKRPDIRSTLVTLRQNIHDGVLSDTIRISSSEAVYEEVLKAMKSSDPDKVRTVLKSNQLDYAGLYTYLYDAIMTNDEVFKKDAQAIIDIGEHCYRDNIVAIKEVNFMHMYFKMLSEGVV